MSFLLQGIAIGMVLQDHGVHHQPSWDLHDLIGTKWTHRAEMGCCLCGYEPSLRAMPLPMCNKLEV